MDNKEQIKLFFEQHPEFKDKKEEKKTKKKKTKSVTKFICRCPQGHIFDYRERERFEEEYSDYFAPAQGMCPYCGDTRLSFVATDIRYKCN